MSAMSELFIIIYLIITLAVGMLASRLVKSSGDFILAGRKLPFAMATATVFATWFGSETVMGASGEFAQGGLLAVIEDPFGAALCLVLVGLFFARPLYRMNLLTFGDFYRVTFGKRAEFVAAFFLIWSYLGWVAAQMLAMGIVLHTIFPSLDTAYAVMMSSAVVIIYTFTGGMWAVSVTDFIQSIMIIAGLLITAFIVTGEAGGMENVLNAAPDGFFRFIPGNGDSWITYIAAWITLGLGSIPQQDVYQRVMSSRNESTAVWSSLAGGLLYLSVALIPLYLGLAAIKLVPGTTDPQMLITSLVAEKTSVWMKIFFFGALLSAIMSTASGALLAPSVILGENIIKPLFRNMTDKRLLLITRLSVVFISLLSLLLAFQDTGIYELVRVASEISLVSLFVPLCAGLFFRSRVENAALSSMLAGALVWGICSYAGTSLPAIFWGTGASFIAYIIPALFRRIA